MPLRKLTDHMLVPHQHRSHSGHMVTPATIDPEEIRRQNEQAGNDLTGRCFHLVPSQTPSGQVPQARLGCEGHNKIPVYLLRDSSNYSSAGFAGDSDEGFGEATPDTWSKPDHHCLRQEFLVGLEGCEIATTEFDQSAGAYYVGDYLRAPESTPTVEDRAVDLEQTAGVVTKRGTDPYTTTIVGIVSCGLRLDEAERKGLHEGPYGDKVISFYTTYRPPALPPELFALLGNQRQHNTPSGSE